MSFGKRVGRFVDDAERKMSLTFKDSAKDVADLANEPTAKGGRLRVDTGFLRASQTAQLGSMPSGPTQNEGRETYSEDDHVGDPPVTIIARWTPGDTLYIGYTASYARYRESKDGFLRGAAEKWFDIVKRNAAKRS